MISFIFSLSLSLFTFDIEYDKKKSLEIWSNISYITYDIICIHHVIIT